MAVVLVAARLPVHGERMPASLPDLLARVDAGNPQVRAQEAWTRAALERPASLLALPDPKLSVIYTNDGLDSFSLGDSEFTNLTVGWEQEVTPRRSRSTASDLARADARVLEREGATLRARLRARVITLYADLYRIDRTSTLVAASREVLTAELAASRARYEAGQGLQEGLFRAQVELSRLDLELESNRRERRSVEIELGEAVGLEGDFSIEPVTSLPPGRLPDEPDTTSGAPALREAEARTERAESAVASARTSTESQFSWLAAYQFRGGLDPMIVGGFGVRLPVYKDRKQARDIARSESELEASRRDAEAATVRVRAEVRALANDAASAERSLVIYEQGIVPQSAAALEAARAALSAGRAEMSLVLDDFRKLLADRKDAVAVRVRRIQALAALEVATGQVLIDAGGTGDTP
jgi:cobalt-zinc-cadmium efflux system outer membrane protein